MTAGVTLQTRLSISGSLAGSNDLGSPRLKLDDILETLDLTPGTDALGKADLMFSDTRTLAASGTEDIDLAGVLSSAFGSTITAAELVLLYVKAHSTNNAANNVNVTRPASNGVPIFLAAEDGRGLAAGEFLLIQSRNGIAVTAGTGDLITITNSAGTNSVTYDIVVIARSVAA
jgi:hypothetical protein